MQQISRRQVRMQLGSRAVRRRDTKVVDGSIDKRGHTRKLMPRASVVLNDHLKLIKE